jgi:flagellar assembly protein FliH
MPPLLRDLRLTQVLCDVRIRSPGVPISNASEEAALARQRAEYERGRVEGENALSEQLLQQRSELLEVQNGVLENLRQALPQVVRQCEASLIALVAQVAQKLVASLPISVELVEASVREALAEVEENAELEILLNPEDLELLRRVESPLLCKSGSFQKIVVRESAEVSRGGCLIQTRFGTIDARRETKLAALRQSLAA